MILFIFESYAKYAIFTILQFSYILAIMTIAYVHAIKTAMIMLGFYALITIITNHRPIGINTVFTKSNTTSIVTFLVFITSV